MFKFFDYTNRAKTFAHKYKKLNAILIQVHFWIIAFLLLSIILHLNSLAFNSIYSIETNIHFSVNLVFAIAAGLFYGIILGLVDEYAERRIDKNISFGKIIFFQILTYYILIIVLMIFSRFVLWEYVILLYLPNGEDLIIDKQVLKYYYWIILIYTFAMAMVISFINQMNKKFGHGVLLPKLLGKYRQPKEEQRIFMFMDLKSSTSIAEKLGHIKYSSLIRDSFIDINKVHIEHRAEVYQYVGDEIVVSWPLIDNSDKFTCVEFYFSCQEQFTKRSNHYIEQYGLVPKFKAGLHHGIVTTVEIGDIKRDIAYHGDTINTTSRIQEKCNELDSDILISESFWKKIILPHNYSKKFVGEVLLKGKTTPVKLISIQFAN